MAAPTNYVLTVYLTEAAAKAGLVDSSTSGEKALAVDADGKINQAGQAAAYGFWTHTKYYYRIEANEPVKEFYIDWDDGEDNDPKGKANYTTIKLDTPAFVGITSHIYTGNSTIAGGYFPKIRCKSVDGYWSKFYQNAAATPAATPISSGIDILQGETALAVGRNDKYRVESDQSSSTNERIPALYPTIKPPVAILKSDKKRVYAGIDNGFLRGSDGDIDGETVTLIEVPNSGSPVRTGVNVKVTYMTTGADGGTAGNRGDIKETSLNTSNVGTSDILSYVTTILKVELLNLLEDSVAFNGSSPSATKLFPGEKMVLVKGAYSDETQQTLAEVSLGNPIVSLNDSRHTVTYDLTESFARTSEQSISNYYLDDGKFKMNNGYAADAYIQWVGSSNTAQDAAANSDIFNDSTGVLEISSGVAKRAYAFDVGYNYVDSDHRWLPKQILARGQIKTSNPSGMTTAKRDQQYSYLEHWVNESHTRNYSDVVDESVATYNWPSDVTSSALLGFKGTQDLDRWVDLEDRNRLIGDDTNFIMKSGGDADRDLSGLYDFDHDNATSLDDADNTAMLICARDSKWTKQFFKLCHDNAVNDSNTGPQGKADKVIPGSTADGAGVGTDGVGHMKTRVQALYTGYENDKSSSTMWKPLKLLNKTKHPDYDDSTWYSDGAFEWEEPEDWALIDPEGMNDKFWPRGDYFTTGDANSWAYSDDIFRTAAVSEVATVTITGTPNITSGTEASSVAIYTGSTDVSDGLSLIVQANADTIIGKYFTFTEQVDAGDVTYYPWFRQAATGTRHTFRVSNNTSTSGTAADFTWQVGVGQQLYSKGLIITDADDRKHGVWLNPGALSWGGGSPSTGVLSPFGALGITTVDTLIEIDTSSLTGSGSTTIINSIAEAIKDGIAGQSEFGATRSGNDVLVTWTHGVGGYVTGFDAQAALGPLATSISNEDSRNYFTYNLDSASYDGKDQGQSPVTHAGLGSYTAIPVDYTDGATDDALATALGAAINGHADIHASTATVSTNVVTLTQQEGGAVADLGHGDSTANSGGDNLDLSDGFTFATTTAGVDTVYGNDWFEDGDKWNATNKKYAIMFLIETDSGASGRSDSYKHMNVQHTWPCSNSHSNIIDLIDPMCVSLNSFALTQSISFIHKGKYQKVEDRLGKSDIRKIGSAGGSIKFGGVDLKDTGRIKFTEFQSKATPVYLDVTHSNGDISRFYGVITSMSEDHPSGKLLPKFSLDMAISHMITMNSGGTVLSDGFISLGGEISESKYL